MTAITTTTTTGGQECRGGGCPSQKSKAAGGATMPSADVTTPATATATAMAIRSSLQPQHPFKRGSPHWDGHWVVACACCWMADINDSRCRRWPMSTTETATTMADVDTRPRLPARQRHHPLLPLPANIDDGQCRRRPMSTTEMAMTIGSQRAPMDDSGGGGCGGLANRRPAALGAVERGRRHRPAALSVFNISRRRRCRSSSWCE